MSHLAYGHDPSIDVYKLEELVRGRSNSNVATSNDATTSDATIMLGSWYRHQGGYEEARACFRLRVLEAISMLRDDKPENDHDGYIRLCERLSHAG